MCCDNGELFFSMLVAGWVEQVTRLCFALWVRLEGCW